MTVLDAVIAVFTGALAGFLSVSAGGGVTVIIPILLALGMTADQANATSRFNLAIGSLIAAVSLVRAGAVNWRETTPILVITVAGTLIGTAIGLKIPSSTMMVIIVATSLIATVLVFIQPKRWLSSTATRPRLPYAASMLVYFGLCVFGGIIAIDSTILRLVFLVLILGLPLTRANPIKVLASVLLFGISSFVYADAGDVRWDMAVWLTLGTIAGAWFAARIITSEKAKVWIYRLLQACVTLETLLLIAEWLHWIPALR